MTGVVDPFEVIARYWPKICLYGKQKEIVESVWYEKETFVVAGNQLGKDYVAGLVSLVFFLTHSTSPDPKKRCRVVTTSVKDEHLDILWGEIDGFLRTAKYPLANVKGAPLLYQHHNIRRVDEKTGEVFKDSYLRGMVSKGAEGMSGHHGKNTLWVADEASGMSDKAYEGAQGWAKHMLVFGNPFPTRNFFYKAVKQGNLAVA